jgi:hypothetical protein
MARQFSLPEIIPPVALLTPAADAGGRTSRYVNLAKGDKAWIVCRVNQGNAATVQFTPLQAQDTSGTGSKAISNTRIWSDLNNGASDQFNGPNTTPVGSQIAQAANYTTDAGLQDKTVVFEISPQDCLDEANSFHTIAIQTGASNAANITAADIYVLHRYQQANPPTILS